MGKPSDRPALNGKRQSKITAAELRRDRDVCVRWLRDSGARSLASEDLKLYRKIVRALNETLRLMAEEEGKAEGKRERKGRK